MFYAQTKILTPWSQGTRIPTALLGFGIIALACPLLALMLVAAVGIVIIPAMG